MLRKLVTASVLAAALWPCAAAQAQTKLLRFPDIHRDIVVFVYAGDLWKAPAAGGTAIRLTSHPGLELFPRVSPDGKWIAFTGQYDGDEQVYVIPARGGEPRQLTYYPSRGPLPPRWGYDHQVYGFTPDSKRVLFRSFRETWDISDSRLYTVSVDGGPAEALPMPNAAPATSRATARGSSTHRSHATSAARSATRAAGQPTSTSSTSTRRRPPS